MTRTLMFGPGSAPSSAIVALPDERLAILKAAYARAGAARRSKSLVAIAVLLAAVAIATRVAEIDPATFWRKLGGLTSYLDRIATLDSGARVWTDPVEWFWGLMRWLRLLGETLLIGYVGTLWGAATAFVLCFAASRKTSSAQPSVFAPRDFWNSAEPCRRSSSP